MFNLDKTTSFETIEQDKSKDATFDTRDTRR